MGNLYDESAPEDSGADIEMAEDAVPVVEIDSALPTDAAADETEDNGNALPFADDAMIETPPRVTYIDYLKSPVIGLLVGQGDEQALLTAHQALLITSPWFADACAKFSDTVSVCAPLYRPNQSRETIKSN